MQFKTKFFIILLFLLFLNILTVSATDDNSTDFNLLNENNTIQIENNDSNTNQTIQKTTPNITIQSNNLKSKDTLEIYFKNSTNGSLESKNLTINLNNKNYTYTTNSNGIVKFPINLAKGTYTLTVSFKGDEEYNATFAVFKIIISKLNTRIIESANYIIKKGNINIYLVDSNGNSVSHKKITIKYNGKKHTRKTNSRGLVKIKLKSPTQIKVKYNGDNQYFSSSLKFKVHTTTSRSIKIGNSKLLSNGYMRIYLKINGKSVSKKIRLFIGNKKLSKKSNSEGIAIFKPSVKQGAYKVKAKVGKYYSSKSMKCYEGNVKDPLKTSITYKNGKPDVDLMPANYVMGDNNGKYTLKKSQYKQVLKRDSYCLYLNNKLTKYTFFKTKNHPKLNHIIKREKWNVIERAINAKLVKKNKHGYWPGKITVSLKGKSYTYPEVRDAQNTGYTCGPTSGSVCSQVLKNYVCEKYLAKLAGTKKSEGTPCSGIKKALEKNHFKCTYYYKASFKKALNQLKKGGCALVFHANMHYVTILDISSNGKKVLVSNSYGSYDNIPTKWLKVSYMKKKFSHWEESLIVKLNYKLSNSTKNSINNYYTSFGANWHKHNTHQRLGL